MRAIAAALEERGIPTARGSKWTYLCRWRDSRSRLPSFRAITRKPSCLISMSHSGPERGRSG